MKAVSYDVFLYAWYRALNGATPSKLTTRADPDDDRFGRGAVAIGLSVQASPAGLLMLLLLYSLTIR